MSKLLTIVIPSYNAERFLKNVMDRLSHSVVLSKMEIIIVNDGSKDGTLAIAQHYQKTYPEDVIVVDKENGGHGSGINQGILHATGKYFKLVDADDWLDDNALTEVVTYLSHCEDDLILTPYYEYDDQRKTMSKVDLNEIFNVKIQLERSQDVRVLKSIPPMHTIIYRTSILKKNFDQIVIDEHSFYVDVEYIIFPLVFIHTLSVLNKHLYCYRTNEPGQSTSIEGLIKNKAQHFSVLRHVNKYLSEIVPVQSPVRAPIAIRVSQMFMVQFKIICLQPLSMTTFRELVDLKKYADESRGFRSEVAPRAIKLLWKSNLKLYPLVQLWIKLQMHHNHQ